MTMESEAIVLDGTVNNYIIPSLNLDDGWFIFSSVSKFLSSITPNDMPLIYCILELLRDAFQSKVSILRIILEALKMESGYICVILIILLISLIPLGYTISWFCSKSIHIKASSVGDIMHTNSQVILPNDIIFHDECREKLEKFNCRKRVYVFILQFLITICVCSILSMFIINEQISTSINGTPNIVRSALKDVEFFVKSSNHQLQTDTFENFDKTREKIKNDLEDCKMSRLTMSCYAATTHQYPEKDRKVARIQPKDKKQGKDRVTNKYGDKEETISLDKYNGKLMNSIWGLYNRNSPHNFKSLQNAESAMEIKEQKAMIDVKNVSSAFVQFTIPEWSGMVNVGVEVKKPKTTLEKLENLFTSPIF